MGAAVACIILDHVRQSQGETESYLRGTGLDLNALRAGECDVSLEQEMILIRNVIDGINNPFMLGFDIGLRYTIASLGMFGLAMVTSSNIMSEVQVATRYLLNTEHLTKVGLFIQKDDFLVVLNCADSCTAAEREFLIGRELGIIVAIQQQLVPGHARKVRRIELSFEHIDGLERIAQLYECEILTGCSKNQVVADAAQLMTPMPLQNNYVAGLCEAQFHAPLSAPGNTMPDHSSSESDFRKKLREKIQTSLPVVLSLNDLAADMHMSSRTFSRLLEKENISWRDYLTRCRLEYSLLLLEDGMSIKQVAERVGFSSSSSFSHAFSRSMGVSPGEYMRSNKLLTENCE